MRAQDVPVGVKSVSTVLLSTKMHSPCHSISKGAS